MQMRAVTVGQLSGTLSAEQRRTFLREMESYLHVDRPRLVLDCSDIRHLDKPLILLLLTCLEEAIKRNGDVKLAAMPQDAKEHLKQLGISHLFEIFDTVVGAVNSFRKFPEASVSHSLVPEYTHQGSESAA
jgi:anti-sigma B factor antagonist